MVQYFVRVPYTNRACKVNFFCRLLFGINHFYILRKIEHIIPVATAALSDSALP